MQRDLPDYLAITHALDKLDTEVMPSEVHGTLCGLLCANTGADATVWQKALWPNLPSGDLLAAEAYEIFKTSHDITRLQLNDPSCASQMLLPDHEDSLYNRLPPLGDRG